MATSNTTQYQNTVPSEPELADLLRYWSKQLKLDLNCHHVGTIQSFDPAYQTATITINYSKTFARSDAVGNISLVTSNYAPLLECPLICLGGGNGCLTFPIQEGDECFVMFNDRDFDNWYSGSNSSAPATTRLHSFSDAIAVVGLRSKSNVIVDYDTDAVAIRMGDNSIKLYDDRIVAAIAEDTTLTMDAEKVEVIRGDAIVDVTTDLIAAYIGEDTSLEMDPDGLLAILDTTSFELTKAGKLSITNAQGEFVAAISQLMQDIQNGLVTTMLGPQPLVMPNFATDLATFDSFKA